MDDNPFAAPREDSHQGKSLRASIWWWPIVVLIIVVGVLVGMLLPATQPASVPNERQYYEWRRQHEAENAGKR